MIESDILTACKGSITSGIRALCITELHRRPLVANSIKQAVVTLEELSPDMLSLTSTYNETHTLESYQIVSREE